MVDSPEDQSTQASEPKGWIHRVWQWLTTPGPKVIDTPEGFARELILVALFFVVLLLAASGAFGLSMGSNFDGFLRISFSAAFICTTAGCLGALLGFIFGVPRALQNAEKIDPETTQYLDNTNFEQVSDWLTKIIVGVSLVQIGRVPAALGELSRVLAPMLGYNTSAGVDQSAVGGFGVAMGLTALLSFFLIGYLWTRVAFTNVLASYARAKQGIAADISRSANADQPDTQGAKSNPPRRV